VESKMESTKSDPVAKKISEMQGDRGGLRDTKSEEMDFIGEVECRMIASRDWVLVGLEGT